MRVNYQQELFQLRTTIESFNNNTSSRLNRLEEIDSRRDQYIKQRFISKTWLQDTWKKIESLRQRNTNISDFNIIFSDLAEILELNGINGCKLYDSAIDQRIVRLGAYWGNYSDLVDLEFKMERAVELANDSAGMAIVEANSQTKHVPSTQVEYRMVNPLPQNAQNKLPPGVPMDLDSALAEVGFNFPAFREECIRRNRCVRCGKDFDGAHDARRRCPLPEDDWMEKSEVLALWKDWGGYLKEDNSFGVKCDPDRSISQRR
ncbi:hypothetical protein PSHT_10115 [Puccinia striiformis]|uniref:Uncharacterized protein n=1 Tax=Puccinia striiformis TaxID=27350 RepID=A0A2S4VC51_9BASI|nr:hypothetical protein PSHT_10115 [Puccinia striiformis]